MSSYVYGNKYKTIAWDSVGRLESDYKGGYDKHDENVAKAVPKITYEEYGEEYYPQVAYSWHEDKYNIDFKSCAVNLTLNSHWKEPEVDENGRYQIDDLEDEETITLVRISKVNNTIRKYKVVLESEEEVTDVKDKIKYGLKVDVEEAVKYWLAKSKETGSKCVAGYYNDLRQFVAVDTFRFGSAISDEKLKEEIRDRYSDCRYVVYTTAESSWEDIHAELVRKYYLPDVKLNGESILDLKPEVDINFTDDDLPF